MTCIFWFCDILCACLSAPAVGGASDLTKSELKCCGCAGCCFIKYATLEEADRAIRALHNQHTLPGVRSFASCVVLCPCMYSEMILNSYN